MLDLIVCKYRDLTWLEMKEVLNRNVGDSKPPKLEENPRTKLLNRLEKY